jgi:hypothetical protein
MTPENQSLVRDSFAKVRIARRLHMNETTLAAPHGIRSPLPVLDIAKDAEDGLIAQLGSPASSAK